MTMVLNSSTPALYIIPGGNAMYRRPPSMRPVVQGDVEIKPLITNEFKLSEIKEPFDLADKDDTAIKIVLRP